MSKNRRRFVTSVALFLAVIMLLSVVLAVIPAMAVTQSQINALESAKSELSEKSKELESKINELTIEQSRYIDRKAALDEQNELNRQEIELIDEQIELYDELIEEKSRELDEAIAREREQYTAFRARMRAMEEHGTMTYLAILFQATSFSDLLSRITDVSDIMRYDKQLEEDYIAAREEVQKVKAEYEETQTEQEAVRVELLDKKDKLEAQIQAAYEMIAELESDLDVYTQAYYENAAEEQELQNQINQMVAELQKQEQAAQQQPQNQNQSQQGTGNTSSTSFLWPTPSCYYVSSPYGWRIHPLFNEQRFHSGIDVAANAGASILASASGTVSIATYSSSYGNYVLINHGNGNTTLYAHMSTILVSAGSYVNQGDVIGYVGSTGWATGPHLHYEIRINNTLVDPQLYF